MKRVLVVDDEKFICKTLVEFLTRYGYMALSTDSGQKAMDILPEFHPDLILLDIYMPEMNGLEVLRKIRQQDTDTGVIMLTAAVDITTAKRAIKEGAWDYVAKPFKLEHLASMLSVYFLMHDKN